MTASIPPSPFENLPEGQITFSQAAAILGVKKSKLESLVKQGTFPTVIPAEYHLPRRLLLDQVEQFKFFGRVSRTGNQIAEVYAFHAHKNHFSSHRGVWYLEDKDVVVAFNNHPYSAGPSFREKELAEFRKRLAAAGLKELGFGTYPQGGYTYAMVIDAPRHQTEFISDVMAELADATCMELMKRSPNAEQEKEGIQE